MKTWQRAEALWRELAAGAFLTEGMPAAERQRALDERRAFRVTTLRDGFGGGSVYFDVAREPEHLEPGSRARGTLWWTGIVLAAPLSETALALLNRNAWEKFREAHPAPNRWPGS